MVVNIFCRAHQSGGFVEEVGVCGCYVVGTFVLVDRGSERKYRSSELETFSCYQPAVRSRVETSYGSHTLVNGCHVSVLDGSLATTTKYLVCSVNIGLQTSTSWSYGCFGRRLSWKVGRVDVGGVNGCSSWWTALLQYPTACIRDK